MIEPDTIRAKQLWWSWMFVTGLTPVLYGLGVVLMTRNFDSNRPILLIGFVGLALILVPAFLHWRVLKAMLGRLNLILWLIAFWGSALLSLGAHAVLRAFDLNDSFLLTKISTELVTILLPVLVITYSAKCRPWLLLIYFSLPILAWGVITRGIMLLRPEFGPWINVFGFVELGWNSVSPNDSWPHLLDRFLDQLLANCFAGAISGYGLIRVIFGWNAGRLASIAALGMRFTVVIGLMLAVSVARYIVGPSGMSANFPAIQRALSKAPERDSSIGQKILARSHSIGLPVESWFYKWSPNGQEIILATKERAVRKIKASNGKQPVGPALRDVVVSVLAWSPDGKYIMTKEDGPNRSGPYTAYLGLLRLLDATTLKQVAEYQATDPDCPLGNSMEFASDSRSAWLVCDHNFTRAHRNLALHVSVPDLTPIKTVRRASQFEVGEDYTRPDLVFVRNGTAYVSTFQSGESGERVSVYNLLTGSLQIASPNMDSEQFGGPRFGFCGIELFADASAFMRINCGNDLSNLPEGYRPKQHRQIAVFGRNPPQLKMQVGATYSGPVVVNWTAIYVPHQNLIIGFSNTATSKTGHIVVWDAKTGKPLQDITTGALNSAQVSPDGRYFAARPVGDDRSLTIYSISSAVAPVIPSNVH